MHNTNRSNGTRKVPSTKHWITQNDRIIDCSIRYEFKLFFALLVEVCRCCLNEIVEIQKNTQKYLPIYFDLNTHCKSDLWQMHLDACWISSFSHGLKKTLNISCISSQLFVLVFGMSMIFPVFGFLKYISIKSLVFVFLFCVCSTINLLLLPI